MDITVTARHRHISDAFREHIDAKLAKVQQVEPRSQRIDVLVSHESNPRQSKFSERVEVTCRTSSAVIRAEAGNDDSFTAFDAAFDKLMERLRRAGDRRRVHRRRAGGGLSAVPSLVPVEEQPAPEQASATPLSASDRFAGTPVEVREKVHTSQPMSLEQALQEMELVGHDFYLFHDVETDRPSVVYRRRGWSYGVIHLAPQEEATG